ncbi:putative vacuolar protein sorting 18 [Leptomonas pyrrhocoris]|uniref:Putative vacuolar protein sorting 18 n=1 Tax=Leptomonas pyrrhocoris TaxID=157538 RepID=A0A0M9FR39_LEPPY|nr:putative vacuolar protein sorting 18 [Leptomonas pyrrhocoris]KPA74297.1 putative vacuolar protein sorting 18 [Leptomonas pyrrhocoris]|eukprot:XP_015652736.1 putative vacuolar protein sorting 18 [Leptomonas pyrrhocoris]
MYTCGEGLQWYDPALLFPSCPLGGSDEGDFENDQHSSAASSSPYQPQRDRLGGGRGTDLDNLSPSALHRHVQHRARELLLDRLSGDTLTSDRDACASVAALVRSLHKGSPVQLTAAATATSSASSHLPPPPQEHRTRATDSTNLLRDSAPRGASSFPASLSGATSQSDGQPPHRGRQRHRHGTHSPMHILAAGDAVNEFNELCGSDSDSAEAYFDDVDADDDFSLGGWSSVSSNGKCGEDAAVAAARHARELRATFLSLPAQLGVQEEPVLCPLDLQADPVAHVVAAAEVFAVVTTTVPQVLYVFDQLNNLPISSSVLGGTSYTVAGSGVRAGHADEDAASLRQSFAGTQMGLGNAAYALSDASASPANAASVRVIACTIDAGDTVQQLWLDPSGHYCVLAFASGKCVYYYVPRRPSAVTRAGPDGTNATTTTTAADARSKGASGSEERGEDDDDDGDGDGEKRRRRRQERHREWKAAARRWLRLSRRRRSASDNDDDGGGGGVDDAGSVRDGDTHYHPRGFSLTCGLPWSSSSSAGAAATAVNAAGSATRSVVPSCVGWSRHVAPTSADATAAAVTTTTAARATASFVPAASSPRGILKTDGRPPASHGASKHLAFTTTTPATPAPTATSCPSDTAVEALLGAREGGSLVACRLTPTGAVEGRVVFTFPAPVAQAPIDAIAAICAPAVSFDPNGTGDPHDEVHRDVTESSSHQGRGAGGVPPSSPRHVRWGCAVPSRPDPADRGDDGDDDTTYTFSTYTHTPHLLSADEERQQEMREPLPTTSTPAADTRDDHSTAAGYRGSAFSERRRWVVLLSVRNRLYVFASPGTTLDFSQFMETREASRTVGVGGVVGGAGSSPTASSLPLLGGSFKAAAHRLSGRIEDAFLLYSDDPLRDVGGPYGQGNEGKRATSWNVAPPSSFPSTQPPTTGNLSAITELDRPSPTAQTLIMAAPSAERLHNYITLEPSAFSEYTATGYSCGASKVHTASPDVAAAAEAAAMIAKAEDSSAGLASIRAGSAGANASNGLGRPGEEDARSSTSKDALAASPGWAASAASPFLVESNTRGTLHLVLPPSHPSSINHAARPAKGCGGGLVTPAALAPVFYWQYGDVVVQGLVLCGAGGLEVGAKVGELVHRDRQTFASASAAAAMTTMTKSTAPPTMARSRGGSGSAQLDAVLPAVYSKRTAPASGLEAGLTAIIQDALHDTQDLNSFADGARTTAADSKDGASGQGAYASLRPTSPSSGATRQIAAGHPSVAAATSQQRKSPRASCATQPALLPIGLLSVINLNSCLQSLRGLLDATSVMRGGRERGPEQDSKERPRGLTYAQCTVRTTALTPAPASSGEIDGVSSAAVPTSGNAQGGVAGWGSKEAAEAAALRHPSLQFPWTSRLQLDNLRRSRSDSATGAADDVASRRHRHHRHRHTGQQSTWQSAHLTSPTAAVQENPGDGNRKYAFPNYHAAHRRSTDSPRPSALLGPSLHIPLLSAALARGDVSAATVRRLCAVGRAYVRRSPVLFGAPVEKVLRTRAAATIAAAEAAVDLPARLDAGPAAPTALALDADGVTLDPRGELLVSMSASYTHITLTTTQGVYVVAHAAVLPLMEAALQWRRELVYHAVTARAATTPAGSPPPASPIAADAAAPPPPPLFTVMADPAAPDVFYLASRARMVRLQTLSLHSSAAGRKQFVVQLLAKAGGAAAAVTQQTIAHSTGDAGGNKTTVEDGGVGAALGQSISAATAEAFKESSSATETAVVVPSSMSYEVRLRGLLKKDIEETAVIDAVRSTRHGLRHHMDDYDANEKDADDLHSGRRGQHHDDNSSRRTYRTASHGDGASVSWRSSRSNSSHLPPRLPSSTADTTPTPTTRSASQSIDPLALSVGCATRMTNLVPSAPTTTTTTTTATRATSTTAVVADDNTGALPQALSITAVTRPQAPVSAAQHFLRHSNRQALLPTVSLGRDDADDAPQRRRSPAAASAATPLIGVGSATQARRPGGVAAGPLFTPQTPSEPLNNADIRASPRGSFAGTRSDVQALPRHALGAPHQSSPLVPPLQRQTTDPLTSVSASHGPATNAEVRYGAASRHTSQPMHDGPPPSYASAGTSAGASKVRQHTTGAGPSITAAAATMAALGVSSDAEDGDIVSFLRENPLLHFLLQRSATTSGDGGGGRRGTHVEAGCASSLRCHKPSSSRATHAADRTRAVNVPGFGVLPGSAGLTSLARVSNRAVASWLLQLPVGADYYCVDHLYELALAAAACATHGTSSATSAPSSSPASPAARCRVVTREDVLLLGLVRHAYGGFLLSQQRFLEAAVQFGKAVDGPTPVTTILIELVRAFRASDSLEPLVVFLHLRLRAMEASALGVGGHGMEVSVLTTWLLSVHLEQCSTARAQRLRYEAGGDSAGDRESNTGAPAGIRNESSGGSNDKKRREDKLLYLNRASVKDQEAGMPPSPDFTRVAWIRRRYHLDHPVALLEDTLLRYSRFVDGAVLSTSVARLASSHEAVLVSELEGSPEKTVMSLVLREQNYFAGLLRLEALLEDPISQSAQTRHLLQSLISANALRHRSGSGNTSGGGDLTAAGTMPLTTVFYGNSGPASEISGRAGVASSSSLPLPAPRDAAALPRTLASLFERFSTLFLCCYPSRFVQEGLLVLLHERQDVPLPPRRLLPALLTYSLANNESVFEATGHPSVVLRALALARRAQQQQQQRGRQLVSHTAHVKAGNRRRTKTERTAPSREPAGTHEGGGASQEREGSAADPAEEDTNEKDEHQKQGKGGGREETKSISPVAAAPPTSTSHASSLAAKHGVEPSLPASFSSATTAATSSSTSLSLSFSISHDDTRAYEADGTLPRDHAAPVPAPPPQPRRPSQPLSLVPLLDESGDIKEYDEIVFDASTSKEEDGGDVDTNIVLSDVHSPSTSSTSHTGRRGSSSAVATTASLRRRGRKAGLFVDGALPDASGRGTDNGINAEERREKLKDSSRPSSDKADASVGSVKASTAPSASSREGHRDIRSSDDDSSSSSNRSRSRSQNVAAQNLLHGSHDAGPPTAVTAAIAAARSPLSSSSSVYYSSSRSSSTSSDAVDGETATTSASTSASSSKSTDLRDGAESLTEDDEDSDADADAFPPLMAYSRGGGGGDAGDDERTGARVRRTRQMRLRDALTPALTPTIVAAAQANDPDEAAEKETGTKHGDASGGSSSSDPLLSVPQHAVLCYLEDLVVPHGVPANHLDGDGADVAIFVAYVNTLARDGDEAALQKFTEQTALQHLAQTDALGSSSTSSSTATSSYSLLHVLRLCATHRRWVGCVWMYYALGFPREAVQLSLKFVVGEEGVRLAVRLLQLLYDRDRRHEQAARRREANTGALHSATLATAAAAAAPHCGEAGNEYTQRQEVRRTRRELWMLVAHYLIQGGGNTKHGAQTALQLSLRSGGDDFNVTDVLPELPDSLFMAELKEELLSSVRELSRKMRGLRANTAALGRDSRVLQRELLVMSHQPLPMQLEERCVLCGQPALARPFTVYPRCRHLMHTSCYHHARQAMLLRQSEQTEEAQREDARTSSSSPRPVLLSTVLDVSVHRGVDDREESAPDHVGDTCTEEPPADTMECLLCARRYLRTMLDAPLHVALVGDDVRQPNRRLPLR